VAHARTQHPNAVLTPRGRRRMVECVLGRGWTVEATAERFQVDAKTVRKWRNRFLEQGAVGLLDRSSRPRRSPQRTSPARCREVIRLRTQHRWGAGHIAHETGLATSTVQSILCRAGLGRLDRGDRATSREPVRRYVRDHQRPSEPTATTPSCTSTITTDPTARSAGQHPPAPSGTTSPRTTASRRRWRVGRRRSRAARPAGRRRPARTPRAAGAPCCSWIPSIGRTRR
jgi:transposase